jgi:hypothetical protein
MAICGLQAGFGGRHFAVLFSNGAPDTIRTCDLCLRRAKFHPTRAFANVRLPALFSYNILISSSKLRNKATLPYDLARSSFLFRGKFLVRFLGHLHA